VTERRRALELEDWFDEEVGPHTRLLAFHEATRDPATVERFVADVLPARLRRSAAVRGGAARFFSAFAGARYGVRSSGAAEVARTKVVAAFDRVESELGDGEYLLPDGFSVADLSAAALLYPVVRPPQGPRLYPLTDSYERFRDELAERPGFRWVEEMFRRHRAPARDLVAA
jgi:glutathione S-transferase